jgi:hypothetical protein
MDGGLAVEVEGALGGEGSQGGGAQGGRGGSEDKMKGRGGLLAGGVGTLFGMLTGATGERGNGAGVWANSMMCPARCGLQGPEKPKNHMESLGKF